VRGAEDQRLTEPVDAVLASCLPVPTEHEVELGGPNTSSRALIVSRSSAPRDMPGWRLKHQGHCRTSPKPASLTSDAAVAAPLAA